MAGQYDEDLRDTIQFHGHLCPGLALGYRVAKAALRELGAGRTEDEELVAVVENDSCAADAIQFITGCSFGKGNLVFHDYGKHVYTFHNRRTGKGVRISEDYRGFENDDRYARLREEESAGKDVSAERKALLMEKSAAILQAGEKDLMHIMPADFQAPSTARIRASVRCASCGERFMESRGRVKDGRIICIPCFGRE